MGQQVGWACSKSPRPWRPEGLATESALLTHSAAVADVFGLLEGVIHEKADAPPTGFARVAVGGPRKSALDRDLPSDPDSPPTLVPPKLLLAVRFPVSHRTGVATLAMPFASEGAVPAWLFLLCSPLDLAGAGGSYEAPVLAEEELPVFCGLSTFMLRPPRPAGW